MASYTSRWTYAPTGYPQPYTDSEKGPQSPLLVSVPGYDTANLAAPPNPQAAPPRRSQTRKFWVRAGHFLLLTLFFVFVAPSLYRRAKSYMTQGGTMHGIPAFASSHPDCVENARWSNHDEELERDYGLDVHPHNFRHLVKTSFNLPLDSELLYFLARGTMSHGSIEVKDDGENGDDNVVVDVSLLYVSDVALEKVEVCHLHRENTKNGVGIFSPNSLPPHHHNEYRTHFAVTVHLPNGAGNRHLYEGFETDMPIFVHNVDDLDASAAFHSISLKTTNAPIHVKAITVEDGRIATTNSPIDGKVVTSNTLDLQTTNGPIKTDVTLTNKGGSEGPSKLTFSTRNSPIRSSISLISSADGGAGGSFDVIATTSNGPIDIVYPVAPVDSTLKFEGHSSNSPVRATLHSTYEGSFSLHSSRWSQPTLRYDDGVEDPAGRGRHRVVQTTSVGKGIVEGNVKWVGNESVRRSSSVNLSTSNAGAQLAL